MVRSELLRAKSLHAEVAYLRDLQKVGDAKRLEQQQSTVLRDKERRFWAEAIKGRPANSSQQATSPLQMQAPLHLQTTAQLERMRQAHSHLSQAHRTHEQATHKLNEGLATLSTSQKRVEILEKLLAKAQRIKANQVESRLSEEVADLVTTSRTVMNLRATLASDGEPSIKGLTSEATPTLASVGERLANQLQAQTQPLQVVGPPQLPVPPLALPMLNRTAASAPISHVTVGQLGISNVSFSQTHREPTLSLTCTIGAQGTVGLRVTKSESGTGLKVVIDPSASGVASGVLREKGAIQSRLQAMGIKVSEIEIAVTGDDSPMTRGAKRSRLHEEEDEGYIS